MTLTIARILLLFTIVASVHLPARSEQETPARSLYDLGVSLTKENPKKSYQILERARELSQENRQDELYIKILAALGSVSHELRKEKQLPEEKQKEVFEWTKEALKSSDRSERTFDIALLHYTAGEYYMEFTNEVDQPIYHYETAQEIWATLEFEGKAEKQADCYHGIADIYKYKKNDFLEAEKAYEKALQLRESVDFKDLRKLFANHYSLATTNRSQHDYEKALSYSNKALEIANKITGSHGSIRQEMINGVLAGVYRDMGESAMAKKHYETAIALNRETQDVKTLAWYYQGLGETYKRDSSYDDAIESLSKSYSIYKNERVSSNLLVYLLQQLAETYALKQDEKKFYKTMGELFHEFEALKMMKTLQASESFVIFGDYHFAKKHYDSALIYYQKGLIAYIPMFDSEKIEDNPSEKMIGYRYYVYRILAKKGSAFKNRFLETGDSTDWHNAIKCLRLSERLLSHERNMLDMQDAKWEFLQSNYDIYEDIISLLYIQDGIIDGDSLFAMAFQYFEKSKARTIADALDEAERTRRINRSDTLFSFHATLRRKLLEAQDKLSTESEKEKNDEAISSLHSQIVALDKQIQACKLSIEEKYPGYFNGKYGYDQTTLENLDELLTKNDKIILEYFWGKEWVYALGIYKDGVLFRKIGKPEIIRRHVHLLMSHFDSTHTSMNYDRFRNFATSAHELYQTLIGPFKTVIPVGKHLQIIPDGPLSQVPFEILLERKSMSDHVDYRSLDYLVNSYNIGYAYSSSTFVHKSTKSVGKPTLLAVGFSGSGVGSNIELGDIAGSGQELELLQKYFNGGKFLVGDEATEANFKTLSPDFDIIHLAIHGRGNVKKSFGASLYFKSHYDSIDDGELHAYELYGLKLKALMAVLTACESGLGKDYKGEGMISMASAFTYSGCENILMSLWQVADQASKGLMNDFYAHLLDGATIDDALRQAKLDYLASADELTADPIVWAPLVAYGSLGKIFYTNNIVYLLITSVGMVALLFVFIRQRKKS